MPWIAPLIAAAGSAVVAGIQSHSNKKLQKLNNQAQVELWNKQNEYNTPSAQMERYKEAGLNPYLAQQNAGLAGSPPSLSAPQNSYAQGVSGSLDRLANLQTLLLNWKAQEANIQNIRAQIGLADAKTQLEREKLQDWRWRNLFGLSNYRTQNFLLNLRSSDLYNKYQLDWTADNPVLDSGLVEDPSNGQFGTTFRDLKKYELLNSFRRRQFESALNYQNAGTSLRNIQASWQSAQNAFGLPANAPAWMSVSRKFAEVISKKLKLHY